MYVFFDNVSVGSAGVLSVGKFTENANSINLAPNPSRNFIEISGLETEETYAIYNVLGVKVKQGIVSDRKKIYVTDLKSAIYFIKIDNVGTKRFVKH